MSRFFFLAATILYSCVQPTETRHYTIGHVQEIKEEPASVLEYDLVNGQWAEPTPNKVAILTLRATSGCFEIINYALLEKDFDRLHKCIMEDAEFYCQCATQTVSTSKIKNPDGDYIWTGNISLMFCPDNMGADVNNLKKRIHDCIYK